MTFKKQNAWVLLIIQFLAGQGLINLLNIFIGLILLRILSIEEFALYTIAMVLQQAAGIGSDMGLSHAVNTMGAKIRDDKYLLGSLYEGARFYGYRFFCISACVVIFLFIFMQSSNGLSWINFVSALFFILFTSVLQVTVNLQKSILNVSHDAKALFHVGLAQAGLRVVFVPLCLVWPYASIALLGNLIGTCASKWVLEHQFKSRLDGTKKAINSQKDALKKFIIPLIPVLVYHNLQGPLSIFLLGYYGYTASIAEFGALGRLGQLIGLFMLLNSFFFMPVFSRISQKNEFIKQGRKLIFLLISFTFLNMLTVYLLPDWWLYILGENYSNLGAELPLAILSALLSLFGATLYVLVISRNNTNGQFWYIILGLLTQVAFVAMHGVHSTYDALLLNLLPILSYVCVQAGILTRILSKWKY